MIFLPNLQVNRELAEELAVAFEQSSQVVQSELQHGHAIDTEPEGETCVGLAIQVNGFEDVGVDHAEATNFKPTGLLAETTAVAATAHALQVDFAARFYEGEEAWAQTGFQVRAVNGFKELIDDAFHIGHADVLIDDEAFDLVEHRRVRRIGVATERPAGSDDAHGRLKL